MLTVKISELLDILSPISNSIIHNDTNIKRVVIDSREVTTHSLFIAINGEHTDGHNYVGDVVKNKSNFAIVERDLGEDNCIVVEDSIKALQIIANYIRCKSSAKIVGITGSNGKTTTRYILEEILKHHFEITSTKGNLNNYIGLPLSITSLLKKSSVGIFEMGISEIGEMELLNSILEQDIGVITSVGESHLEKLIDVEHVALEKAKAVIGAKEFGVVNGDSDVLKEFLPLDKKLYTFGFGKHNDFAFELIHRDVYLNLKLNDTIFETNFIGFDNSYSIMAAITVATILGLLKDDIARYIKTVYPLDGRLSVKKFGSITLIDDAYNANPQSVKNLIRTVDEFVFAEKRYVVLGEMRELGEKSLDFHREIVSKFSDRTVYLLKGDIYKSLDIDRANVMIFDSNDEIIKYLQGVELNNCVIGIKGSHSTKMYEIVKKIEELKDVILFS